MLPEGAELLVFAAAALAFAFAFAPAAMPRRGLIASGGAGLVGTAAIVAAPTFDVALLVLLALGVLQVSVDGRRSFAVRLRAPVVAVAMLALGLAFVRVAGPAVLARFAAVGLVAGIAAAVGLLPYIHPFDPEEDVQASPVAWLAFVGPVLATVLVFRAERVLPSDAGVAFAAMLIGLGVLNMAWASVASWLTASTASAWRYSFIADWGLVLAGLGLMVVDGRRAALLILFSVMLGRLPLYLVFRESSSETKATDRPINLVVAAALAGSAPFAGFAARILLLRAATQLFWPLALVIAVGMLMWLPGSLRLGRSLGTPSRRQTIGVTLILALNVAAGLYPLPFLGLASL